MRKPYRRLTIRAFVSLVGLAAFSTAWLAAVAIALKKPTDHCGLAIGYAHGESWLAIALIQPNGLAIFQLHDPNLTYHRGIYAKKANFGATIPLSTTFLLPQKAPFGLRRAWCGHLALPVLFFVACTFWTVLRPVLRRKRWMLSGLCPNCAYDLTGNVSGVCPECGTKIENP